MSYRPKAKRNTQLYNFWLAYQDDDAMNFRIVGERFPKPDGTPLSRERVRQIVRKMERAKAAVEV